MPTLTLAQLMSHATRMANAPSLTASLASEYVNLAYTMVALDAGVQHAPRETLAFASTSTDTTTIENRVALPTDCDYVIDFKIGIPNSWSTATSRTTAWTPLRKQPAPWGDSGERSDITGQPTVYAEFNTWLELRPSPNSIYSVQMRYARKLDEMTSSTSTPVLDNQWHWGIAVKAAELIAAQSQDSALEVRNAERYGRYVSTLRLDQAKRRMDTRGMHVTLLRSTR